MTARRGRVGRRRAAVLAGALAGALLLGGCASSPEADLNAALSDVTDAANARNAARLRTTADELIAVINRQSGSSLGLDRATSLRALAEEVKADAALLEQAATPAPVPSTSTSTSPSPAPTRRTPTPAPTSASPTPTPTPTPSASPSPTPSASPTPKPSATTAPATTPVPTTSTTATAVGSPPSSPTSSAAPLGAPRG